MIERLKIEEEGKKKNEEYLEKVRRQERSVEEERTKAEMLLKA